MPRNEYITEKIAVLFILIFPSIIISEMWIKFRIVPHGKKPKRPESIIVNNPHLPFCSEQFLRQIARKLKLTYVDISTNYHLIYQKGGMADMEGVPVGQNDSFYSLKLLDGAPFLCVENEPRLSSHIYSMIVL